MVQKRKHMRLPNGFGSITKLKRNLRRPYLARVTNSKDDLGRPILKSLGYYKTYNDAYMALMEYNQDPYDLDALLSVSETYRAYIEQVFAKENHSKGYTQAVERAFRQSEPLHDIPIRNIRPRHIKQCMNTVNGSHAKGNFKNFWNRLLDYAVANELTDRNYAREFRLDPDTANDIINYKRTHLTFTPEEMSTLWNNKHSETAKMVLIQSFMGWRPDELCNITVPDVNLQEGYIIGGNKTEAGMGRVVPIHSAVRPLVSEQYEKALASGSEYLYDMNYYQYHHAMKKMIKELGLDPRHRPHDPRKQFVTMAKKAGIDDLVIKRLVGHKISDITEKSYTDRDLEWLRTDIEKIDVHQYTNSVQVNAD